MLISCDTIWRFQWALIQYRHVFLLVKDYGDKTDIRLSYLYNGIFYTGIFLLKWVPDTFRFFWRQTIGYSGHAPIVQINYLP